MQEENQFDRRSVLLWIFAICIGVIYNYLFYGKGTGVSYPIAVSAFYGLFFWVFRGKVHFRVQLEWLLFIPIIMLSMSYALYSNPVFNILNQLSIPLLIAIQTILMTGNSKYDWHDNRFFSQVLRQLIPLTLRHIPTPVRLMKVRLERKSHQTRYTTVLKVILGLLVSVPILIIVIPLLISADQLFGEVMGNIPNLLTSWNAGELIFRAFLILFVAFYVFAYLWGLLFPKQEKHTLQPIESNQSAKLITLDAIISLTAIIIINSVYVLFVSVQFSYLFGGAEGLLPDGTTYAEHARSGFGQLVFVTLLNFSILLTIIRYVQRDQRAIYKLIQAMLSLLVICTFVILCSAYVRLSWYEQAYGYTYSRVLVHAFLIFLSVVFSLTLYKIWRERFHLLKFFLMAAMIAFVSINYMNMDRMIIDNNIERYVETGDIDINYIRKLSYDAVPGMIELSRLKDPPEGIERTIEGVQYRLKSEKSWSSVSLSKYRAVKALKDLK